MAELTGTTAGAVTAFDPAATLSVEMPRTLVLTGHFPPEPGGVQTFTWELARRLPPERLVVVGPSYDGDRAFDRTLPFPVLRRRGYWLTRDLRRVVADTGCTAGWIPATAPFGLFAPRLRAAGVQHVVASTHGQELGWLKVAPTREALRRVVRGVDVVTCLGSYTEGHLARVVDRPGKLHHLAGGVDTSVFHPGADDAEVRSRLGLTDGPLVVSVSRLVRRKGHDVLLRAWPEVLRQYPGAQLVIVGIGPMREPLEQLARELQVHDSVLLPGFLPLEDVSALLAAADAFVMPSRDDRAGLQTEGLGLAALEASACGTPVVVGRSGGSVDAVQDGVTGLLVRAEDPAPVRDALLTLLGDPVRARRMGQAGAAWVRERWTWDRSARRLAELLAA
ncbi:MAG TPA: glycosyltransferase family 4 protein [Motilibacteraceae bacterium]|nr:glycosyltransferase family 4 protein [Motilibacteraceae bacterium]